MAKSVPDQMSKTFQICKWISFDISTFDIVEEMAFSVTDRSRDKDATLNNRPLDRLCLN